MLLVPLACCALWHSTGLFLHLLPTAQDPKASPGGGAPRSGGAVSLGGVMARLGPCSWLGLWCTQNGAHQFTRLTVLSNAVVLLGFGCRDFLWLWASLVPSEYQFSCQPTSSLVGSEGFLQRCYLRTSAFFSCGLFSPLLLSFCGCCQGFQGFKCLPSVWVQTHYL